MVAWTKKINYILFLSNVICILSATQTPRLGILVEKTVWKDDVTNISRTVFKKVNELYGGLANLDLTETSDGNPFSAVDDVCKMVETESQVIISFVGCKTARILVSQTRLLNIPQIIFVDEACRVEQSQSSPVVFQNHYNVFGKVAAALTSQMKWVDVNLIHDASLNFLEVHEFLTFMSKGYARSRIFNLSNGSSQMLESGVKDVVSTIGRLKLPTFVHLTSDNFDEFFERVRNQGLLSRDYFWILMCFKTREGSRRMLKVQISNVVLISGHQPGTRTPNSQCNYRSGLQFDEFLLHDAMMLSLETLNNYRLSNNGNFTDVENCLYPPEGFKTQCQEIAKQIWEIDMTGISGRISFDNSKYLMNDYYTIESTDDNADGNFTTVAKWTNDAGLFMSGDNIFHNAFHSFANRTLLISTQEMRPFVQKETRNNGTIWNGMCIDILDELSYTLDFKYIIVEPEDGMWGGPNSDGTWNGIVGQVQTRKVEFGVGPFTITSLREKVIDFTKPFLEDGVGIITKRESEDSEQFFKIFQPFQYDVWIFTGVSIIAAGVTLFVTNKFSPFSRHGGEDGLGLERASLKSSMWLIFGTYMEQGGEPQPTSTSGRIVLGFWWLFTLLMASTYTANLAAFLTVTISKKPINSMSELVAQTGVKPNVLYGSNLYDAFEESNDALYSKIWQSMKDSPKLKEMGEQLALVRTGKFALLADRLSLEYVAYKNCESYSLADEISNTAGYGFVLPENAPYMEAFNHNIIKMQESGLMAKWRKKWWSDAESCSGQQTQSGADILDLESIGGLFVIYGLVCCSAVFCLFVEMALLVRNNRRIGEMNIIVKNKDTKKQFDKRDKNNKNVKY